VGTYEYVVVYEKTAGHVLHWARRLTSDNLSTWQADGHLTVDGVKISEGEPGTDANMAAVLLDFGETPFTDEPCGGSHVVDDFDAPEVVAQRGDGERDPRYPYEEP
jgi:hypothetical protein